MLRIISLCALVALSLGLVGCGSVERPLEPLQAMLGTHKFSGFSITEEKRENILGTSTQVAVGDRILIHFEQNETFKEEAFGVLAYDRDEGEYTLQWESNRAEEPFEARGNFDSKGRLVLDGTISTMVYTGEKGSLKVQPCQYVITLPEDDRFVLSVRLPMSPHASYTNFRMLAIRKDGAPDPAEFQKQFDTRRAQALAQPKG